MKIATIFVIGITQSQAASVKNTLDKRDASAFLAKRVRRGNGGTWGRLEELKEGHLVRECYKETCSYDEALEAIESIRDTKVFWDMFTEPCKKLNPCGAHKCNDLSRGHFVCQCEDGFDGMSCDHDCSSKNAPLTVDLQEDSYGSSTFIPTYEPFQARWNQGLGYFHVPTGGFPNVWKPQLDDAAPYLWIDLGERRTVFSMAIRSGYHKGEICAPNTVEIVFDKKKDFLEELSGHSYKVDNSTVMPQKITLNKPVYAQFIAVRPRFSVDPDPAMPACLAIEFYGRGGSNPAPNNCK